MKTDPQAFPYATHLNHHYSPLQLVDVPTLVAACQDRWHNRTRAPERATILMLENAGIVPTGD